MSGMSERWYKQQRGAKDAESGWDPMAYVGASIVFAIIGGILAGVLIGAAEDDGVGNFVLIITLVVAGALFLIGIISQGVVVGLREAKRDRP